MEDICEKEIITLKWVDYRPSEDVEDQVYVWASFDSKGREIFRKEVSSHSWMWLHAHGDYEARIVYEKLFPKGFIIKTDFKNCLYESDNAVDEAQEIIYDENGWCWDLSLIDKNEEYHFLIESHREGVGYKVTDKKSYYQGIGLTWFIEENLEQNESLGDKIIAWRPLPPLPTLK